MRRLRPNRGRLLVVVVLIVLSGTLAGAARVTSGTQTLYLALGDSITYGIQPTSAKPGAPASAFRTGYVDVFAARLRKLSPQLEVVNHGRPGESDAGYRAMAAAVLRASR